MYQLSTVLDVEMSINIGREYGVPVYIPAFIGIHGPTDAQFVRLGVARMYISPIGRSAFTEVGKNTHDGNFWPMAKSDEHGNLYI